MLAPTSDLSPNRLQIGSYGPKPIRDPVAFPFLFSRREGPEESEDLSRSVHSLKDCNSPLETYIRTRVPVVNPKMTELWSEVDNTQ